MIETGIEKIRRKCTRVQNKRESGGKRGKYTRQRKKKSEEQMERKTEGNESQYEGEEGGTRKIERVETKFERKGRKENKRE